MSRRAGCGLAVLLLLSFGTCGLAAVRPNGDTPVPRITGHTLDQAESTLRMQGLRLGRVRYDADALPPHGIVVEQEPQPGWETIAGGKVSVVIAGPQLVRVPRVIRAEEKAATDSLKDAGVRRGKVMKVHDDYFPAGSVISQEPAGGTSVPKDTKVRLVVSLGPDSARMPGVVGRWRDEAKGFLFDLGLETRVDYAYDPHVEGIVVSQWPSPGTDVPLGDKVTITVSRGPKIVRVPNVCGLSAEDAYARLRDAGLLPRQTPGRSPAPTGARGGTVYVQQPSANATLAEGAVVTYSVSPWQ